LRVAAGAIGLLAGVLMCALVIVFAIGRFRRDGEGKDLLASLAAAIVALVCGAVTQFVVFYMLVQPETGFYGVTASTAVVSYLSSVLSIPIGMGWGWVCRFALNPAQATRSSAPSFVVRGLVIAMIATSLLVVAAFVGRLARHGHDSTIGLPGISAALAFPALMMIVAAGLAGSLRTIGPGRALRQVGLGLAASVILALGVFVAALAVDSLPLGTKRLAETWNVLILFYPVYLVASCGIAGALLFYGGRIFARTLSRLSDA
jgi:hypothetical protein